MAISFHANGKVESFTLDSPETSPGGIGLVYGETVRLYDDGALASATIAGILKTAQGYQVEGRVTWYKNGSIMAGALASTVWHPHGFLLGNDTNGQVEFHPNGQIKSAGLVDEWENIPAGSWIFLDEEGAFLDYEESW